MSADNGIYIAEFPGKRGPEYRVIHAQAIENCDALSDPIEWAHAYRALYFGDAMVHYDKVTALMEASTLFTLHGPYIEYGIQHIRYDEPFVPMTQQEANNYLRNYTGLEE